MAVLHYFHDPLCGWCYGAAPLVDAASEVTGVTLELLAGGLWPTPLSPPRALREQIRAADARIGQLTGQPFGDAYLDGWLTDDSTMLHSHPPTAAWLAVQTIEPALSLPMLRAIQRAHYVDGRRVVEPAVLEELAQVLDIDADRYRQALSGVDADAHIEGTRRQMRRLNVAGFPGAFLEIDGRYTPVRVQSYFGDPGRFAAALEGAVK